MTMMIRTALPNDAEALATFAERTFRETFAPHNTADDMNAYCAESFGVARQGAEIVSETMTTLLGEVDGRLAGYVQFCWDKHPDCLVEARSPGEVRRIYVDRDDQGGGYGRVLLEAANQALLDRGTDQVWLAVWDQNNSAIAFYERLGFSLVGRTEFVLGTDVQQDLIVARPRRRRGDQS